MNISINYNVNNPSQIGPSGRSRVVTVSTKSKYDIIFIELLKKNMQYLDFIGFTKMVDDVKKVLHKRLDPILPKKYSNDFNILDWNVIEVARQLTLSTYYLYCHIDPIEYINYDWRKKDPFEYAPNLLIFLDRFNRLMLSIVEEILSYDTSSNRAHVIEKYIDLALTLKNFGNINDFVNVVYSLNSLPITNLRITLNKIKRNAKNTLHDFNKYCYDIKLNYKSMREDIKIRKDSKLQCIPFVGLILKDIDKIKNTIPLRACEKNNYTSWLNIKTDYICLDRINMISNLLSEINEFKKNDYFFKPVFKLAFLYQPLCKEESNLMKLSQNLGKLYFIYINRTNFSHS